jgi:hypothetical protein
MRPVFNLIVGLCVILSVITTARAQTAPAYPELFNDPPQYSQLTQADLPNLARQVVLETTSMFVHARTELYDSTAGSALLNQINLLWNTAAAFDASVSSNPTDRRTTDAGRLVFPDVQAAFGQIQDSMTRVPGATRCGDDTDGRAEQRPGGLAA